MKKKNLIKILVVCIISALLLLSACTPQSNEDQPSDTKTQEATEKPETTEETPSEMPEEPVEISYLVFSDLAVQDSWITQNIPILLKEYGYNVTFNMIEMGTHDGDEWNQKFNLRIASGEAPADLMQLGGLVPEAVSAGYFLELTEDMIFANMPKIAQQATDVYENIWMYGKDPATGIQYGVPSFNMYGPNRHSFAYNKDWLDALGYTDYPVTIEDFEQFLRDSRTLDFNGNGDYDEFGYTSGYDQRGMGFNEIFAAYGVMPFKWMIIDGELVRGELRQECKEVLTLLAKWYEDDLIPKGVGTTEKKDQRFFEGTCGTKTQAYVPGMIPGGSTYEKLKREANSELLPAPPPEGPEGQKGGNQIGPKKYLVLFGSHLADDMGKAEMIMQMLETIATNNDLFEVAMFGEKGVHWNFVDEAADSGPVVFTEDVSDLNVRYEVVGTRQLSESAFCPLWVEEVYGDYIDPRALEYASHNDGYYDVLLDIQTPAMVQYGSDLEAFTKTYFLDVITGADTVDNFDQFVEDWKANGGNEIIAEAKELYEKLAD